MRAAILLICLLCFRLTLPAQANITISSPTVQSILLGNYTPQTYNPAAAYTHPDTLSHGIQAAISPDSLHAWLERLSSFDNRNTGSDTLSSTRGIGAARRWVYQKFTEFAAQSGGRLQPAYLSFDRSICGVPYHRQPMAVLPGMDTTDRRILIVEAHIDSRCEGNCDTNCTAAGMEDNASGTALVMELARVMSRYQYRHTIVFFITIAEEQGLFGAEAFSDWLRQQNVPVMAVQNNDVIGGIYCGQTSSPPSCPALNDVDSTGVRLFSAGSINSPHKGYCRYLKLEYKEQIQAWVPVPTDIRIMSPEDRTGRGGDHIPFRQGGFTAMRFTSANEHGDANSTSPSYTDRQHSYRDILGVDTDGDQVIDSFFVDFRYLARNAVINGNALGMAAISPAVPAFTLTQQGTDFTVTITNQTQYPAYRIGVRSLSHDFDTVYTLTGSLTGTWPLSNPATYYISVASQDSLGVESLFSGEQNTIIVTQDSPAPNAGMQLLPNRPNPFDEATWIGVHVQTLPAHSQAWIEIRDMQGKWIQNLPLNLHEGDNEVLYEHGYGATGAYHYSLVIDGVTVETRTMIFAN